jgi:hypothetical protein
MGCSISEAKYSFYLLEGLKTKTSKFHKTVARIENKNDCTLSVCIEEE